MAFPANPPPPETVEEFLKQQQGQDLLRFITCGSVDDGKSTLIGRLLWESRQLYDDQLAALERDSRKHGTQGDAIDFALLVDGLSAEREQGITIDVAYRFFSTSRRKFIVADTPGHEQYTRNMVTGASTADVALILVDATQGILRQTRRHAFIASLMGIQHVVLAVNKMDLAGFEASVFEDVRASFQSIASNLGFGSVTAIPLSALQGDNIVQSSSRMPWYRGPTLLKFLESVPATAASAGTLAFPVQWVNRPNANFRGFSGTVAQGSVSVGDTIRVTASGQTARVKEIVTMGQSLQVAVAGEAVTLTMDHELDISRGDVLSAADRPLQLTDQFEAHLVWFSDEGGMPGRSYDIKLATQWATASLTGIRDKIDIATLSPVPGRSMEPNDIARCTLAVSKPLVCDSYANSRTLGSFILVDRFTHATVAAGMIRHSLRRADNVHRQALAIARPDRERLNGHPGRVVWLTGLSGSGKSTLASALEARLHHMGRRTYILDGDNVRLGLNKDLGFTEADRVENIRRVAEVARLMLDAGLIVITAFISPFARERAMARELIGAADFLEVYVSTSLEVCEHRDVKGLYRKARAGLLPNLSGLGSPYEVPEQPDVTIDTENQTIAQSVDQILSVLSAQAG